MNKNSWSGYFKVVTPKSSDVYKMNDSQDVVGGAYNNFSWYQRIVQGSASRLTRYREYDLMDNDVEIARALDTIAEEMTGNNPKTMEPLDIDILAEDDVDIPSSTVITLKSVMRRWVEIHRLDLRLFKITRMTAKYGDVFFRRDRSKPHGQWQFIHPKHVVSAIVDAQDVTKVIAWQVVSDVKKPKSPYSTPINASNNEAETETVDARDMIHFSLNDDMSDTQPFGESILASVYRSHKQKELLEDAIIIYRVQRAPERRVFYIDVGKLPPQRAKTYLENIKNEIRQKKVPSSSGGKAEVDSVYNPQSSSEDFFFASRPDGRGSRVETLPGGQGLGELSDLEYFQRKVWRGLRVPASYMIEQQEGGNIWNDGKVGVAYIQELRFAEFIERLQRYIEDALDVEFKQFLRACNVTIDPSLYRVRLPAPSNFGKYKQQEMDTQLLSAYGSADGIEHLSPRFALKRFLQLTDEEIIMNQRLRLEELGLDPDSTSVADMQKVYGIESGAGGGSAGGGLGGGFGGAPLDMSAGGGLDDMGGDTPDAGESSTAAGGEVATSPTNTPPAENTPLT